MTAAHKTLKERYDTDILQFNSQKAEENAANSERIQELEDIVKELEEQNDSLKSQTIKDQAVANQKLEFVKLQLEQEQKQKDEMKSNHERILKSFQND